MPGLACAYLHGSFLTDYFRPDCDIDISLLFFHRNSPASTLDLFVDHALGIETGTTIKP